MRGEYDFAGGERGKYSEPHLRVVQLLCPERHCILASFYEWPRQTKEDAIAVIEKGRKDLKCDPWCLICKSMDLQFEDMPTRFKTMVEAAPSILENQLECMAANLHFQQVNRN